MDYHEIANTYFGGNASAFARQFNLTPGAVAHWKKTGKIPDLRAAQIELWILKQREAEAK